MSQFETLLVELVQIAEAPLYSAYRWIGRRVGRDIALDEYLRLVDRLLEQDVLRLWSVDPTTYERTRCPRVPSDLGQQYAGLAEPDESFDPFGLSLTLGPAAEPDRDPDWRIDLNEQTFTMHAKPGCVDIAREQMVKLFPDLEFCEGATSAAKNEVTFAGSFVARNTDGERAP